MCWWVSTLRLRTPPTLIFYQLRREARTTCNLQVRVATRSRYPPLAHQVPLYRAQRSCSCMRLTRLTITRLHRGCHSGCISGEASVLGVARVLIRSVHLPCLIGAHLELAALLAPGTCRRSPGTVRQSTVPLRPAHASSNRPADRLAPCPCPLSFAQLRSCQTVSWRRTSAW